MDAAQRSVFWVAPYKSTPSSKKNEGLARGRRIGRLAHTATKYMMSCAAAVCCIGMSPFMVMAW